MAGIPAAAQTAAPLVFVPVVANRVCILLVLLAGPTVLMTLVAHAVLSRPTNMSDVIVVLVFGITWLLVIAFGISLVSIQAELTSTHVRRKSVFGVKTLEISNITSALVLSGAKGSRALVVRTAIDRLAFTNASFSNSQLREMQEFIRQRAAEVGRQIQTTVPNVPLTPRQTQLAIVVYLGILVMTVALVAVFGVAHQRKVQQAHHAANVVRQFQSLVPA